MTRPTKLSDFDGYNFHIVPVSCAKCGADGLLDLVLSGWAGGAPLTRKVAMSPRHPFRFVVLPVGEPEIRCGECDEQTE